MKRLENKSALITGAAQGIGKGFAAAYVREGARVAIADINFAAAQASAEEIGSGAYAVRMDVSDQSSIDAGIAAVIAHAGKLDILINCAALFDGDPIVDITRESYEKLYAVNVGGSLFTLQAAARQMIKQGHGGKIINMASQAGRRGEAVAAIYCSTKAAIISLTQSAGLDLIQYGINVNAIAPGVVEGPLWVQVDAFFARVENKAIGQKKKEVAAGVPAGRFAVPADLAGMAIFLASSESDYILAQTYNVDGGQWMS